MAGRALADHPLTLLFLVLFADGRIGGCEPPVDPELKDPYGEGLKIFLIRLII